ncbi:MAG: hypothetical protein BYD32DRAFT_437045 [Podila humilis]|nr:MAG: hypothetical protein BYD32DRAFT_437045 [Podila humilis]
MSSPLSALRRPRPLSLSGSRSPMMKRMSHPMEGSVLVRWASIAPYLIEETGPPSPPRFIGQVQLQQSNQYDIHQDQTQLENGQRARQQKEMQRILAKDRLLLREQVQHQQQQRAHEYMAHSRQTQELQQKQEKQRQSAHGEDSLAQALKAHRRMSSGNIALRNATCGTRGLGHKKNLSTSAMATFLHPLLLNHEAISEEFSELDLEPASDERDSTVGPSSTESRTSSA